jgi:hypothetical protein
MEDNTLIRTPNAQPEPEVQEPRSTDEPIVAREKTEPTPAEMVELKQPPYIIDLMEAHDAYPTFDVEENSKLIDSYIRVEAKDDTREEYKKILDKIYKNIKPAGDIYTNLKELAEWVRIQNKLKEALREKEEFEAMDPLDMSARQLRRFLDERH